MPGALLHSQIVVIHISAATESALYQVNLFSIGIKPKLVGIFHYLTTFTTICSNIIIPQDSKNAKNLFAKFTKECWPVSPYLKDRVLYQPMAMEDFYVHF